MGYEIMKKFDYAEVPQEGRHDGMKGKWMVTMQYIGGEKIYQVFRLKDVNGVDHSGNREYQKSMFNLEMSAQYLADRLNDAGV